MGQYFRVEMVSERDGVVDLRIGFGDPAQIPQILPDAVAAVSALNLTGGKLVRFYGPCAVPVAMALAHAVAHLFGAVACFDPKVSPGYVVCISHDPAYVVGQQLE